MAQTLQSPPWTHERLLRDTPVDNVRREVLEGELHVAPSAVVQHQRVVLRLARALMEQVEDRGQGLVLTAPMDVVFSETVVLQPDILVIRSGREGLLKGHVHGVPDLVIEVLSPSNRSHDTVRKRRLYERFEVPEYWLVDPAEGSVEILVLEQGRFRQHALHGPDDQVECQGFDCRLPLRRFLVD